jgi:predicted 3-demethylubiquinone-9 3-methyltransferase (glyoxalase superfamily)
MEKDSKTGETDTEQFDQRRRRESVCGWLKDKYGFSWQIIPFNISELLLKPEVADELLKMKKIDMEVLKSTNHNCSVLKRK